MRSWARSGQVVRPARSWTTAARGPDWRKSVSYTHLDVYKRQVLYQLGYDELNVGRHFKIQITDNGVDEVYKQVDVFAKDDHSVIVAECKSSVNKGPRNLQKDIMEFAANKRLIARAVSRSYGKDSKLKFVWLFVTRNIQVSQNHRLRADNEQIYLIQDRDLRYYEAVSYTHLDVYKRQVQTWTHSPWVKRPTARTRRVSYAERCAGQTGAERQCERQKC